MKSSKPIIFFDGVCNLCNGAVNFIIDHDKKGHFKFAPLQSNAAEKHVPLSIRENTDSILLVDSNKIYSKSTAALKVAKNLNGPWKALYIFIIFPKFVRDFVYDQISRNRYKWFGKRDTCRMPSEEIKNRFVEMD
ncbi:thiol-disulfide oxidoreductase DCC family protein [Marivirga harenae]|uniref:thiol-disulfide oxidoreductase DCC family protein n=1 Tax=Marivirga harenae TaxID=2010992 RepID=UPI0026E0266B|nr:thiol-disulfide oxidoreductase DCC family protein [Marivirga harenae]WKV12573.1 thiol-disulfide oxidoreductase DCC family protein [Marivirga harenae]